MPLTDESRVLVIYTGGTIGMLVGHQGGYVPEPHFLTETLRYVSLQGEFKAFFSCQQVSVEIS